MEPAVPPPTPPLGGGPVLFGRETADRTKTAVKYVEGMFRGHSRRGDEPSALATGVYAYLASGTITAASGGTLGSGTVQICARSGATLTANGPNIPVYNAGGSITGPAYMLLQWADGDWVVAVAPC